MKNQYGVSEVMPRFPAADQDGKGQGLALRRFSAPDCEIAPPGTQAPVGCMEVTSGSREPCFG